MDTPSPADPLNGQLWQKFMHLAQPYWFPQRRGSTAWFLGVLLLLLIFLASVLALGAMAISVAAHHWQPNQFDAIAPGLWPMIQQLGLPFVGLLGLGLVIPAIVFLISSRRLRGRVLPWLLLSVLLLLSLTVNGLNVIISYVGRFFQTALADQDVPTFWRFLCVYAGVFVVGTLMVVSVVGRLSWTGPMYSR